MEGRGGGGGVGELCGAGLSLSRTKPRVKLIGGHFIRQPITAWDFLACRMGSGEVIKSALVTVVTKFPAQIRPPPPLFFLPLSKAFVLYMRSYEHTGRSRCP